MSARTAGLLWALLGPPGLALGVFAEPAPPCRVETSVEPARAVVGQQVLYRARVLLRDDVDALEWVHPVAFPHVRTEALPGDPRPGRVERAGVAYRIRDELRALFGERRGTLRLRAPDLLCRSGRASARISVPEIALEVFDPPLDGRPESYEGLVGPVVPHVTVTPREVRLGESVRVAVMLDGAGNLWLQSPLFGERLGAAEVFETAPELVFERGRALFARRHFIYDLVPRETGTLRIPELAIAYYDPQAERYATARTPAVDVAVHPRAAAAQPPHAAAVGDPAGRVGSEPDGPGAGTGLAIVAVMATAIGFGAWCWRRRRAGSAAVSQALAELRRAGPAPPPSLLARALRSALERHLPDARSAAAEELLARPDLPAAVVAGVKVLAAVERARFDPGAPLPEVAAVEAAIAAL